MIISEEILASFRKNHFGLQFGFEKFASKTTFLSLPSLAYWSTSGFRKLSCFCQRNTINQLWIIFKNLIKKSNSSIVQHRQQSLCQVTKKGSRKNRRKTWKMTSLPLCMSRRTEGEDEKRHEDEISRRDSRRKF